MTVQRRLICCLLPEGLMRQQGQPLLGWRVLLADAVAWSTGRL